MSAVPAPGAWTTCPVCEAYAERRMPVVYPEIERLSESSGEHRALILRRLMRGVHARHLDGLAILPGAAA